MNEYQDILAERDGRILQLTLNRPQARNALRTQTLAELASALDAAADDDEIRCVVVYGNLRVFAAGADLKEMSASDMIDVLDDPRGDYWARIAAFPKPLIAAVNGFALGGGCELVLNADIVVAGDNAQFGQPEINLGIIPGAGGTQRLIRSVGKSLASKMVLSGQFIDAATALHAGLVSDVVLLERLFQRQLEIGAATAHPAVAHAFFRIVGGGRNPDFQGGGCEIEYRYRGIRRRAGAASGTPIVRVSATAPFR